MCVIEGGGGGYPIMHLYGVINISVFEYIYTPSSLLIDNFIENNAEISTSEGENTTTSSNTNMMATMDTSKVHISTFPLNLIVNDASLSTGRWMKSNFFSQYKYNHGYIYKYNG